MGNRNSKKLKICLSLSLAALMVCACAFSGCDLTGGEDPQTPDPAVYLYESTVRLEVGETVQLSAVTNDDTSVMWMSDSEAIATVSESGLVTGIGAGETTISVGSAGGAIASCKVVVTEKAVPEGVILISQSEAELKVGETLQLTALTTEEGVILWDSSEKTVAKVSADGLVTALAKGTTTVTAFVGSLTVECEVTVTDAGTIQKPDPTDPDLSNPEYAKDGYNLVWHDEFNGNALDTTKWGYQTGVKDSYEDSSPWYWGNDELQYYTEDSVAVTGGSLVITASRQDMPNGRPYKSGRILTRDKATWTYGYFEARIKSPTGNGMWPAFWMLPQPTNAGSTWNEYTYWPANGEIDIFEAKGRLANVVDTTLHFGGCDNAHDYQTQSTTLSSNTDQWHTYAVEWTSSYIDWYVDGARVLHVASTRWWSRPTGWPANVDSVTAPFDKPFYILFNLAVGGQYDGYVEPDAANFSPASMYVDYVRVYKAK